jgi:hypothetical protein
MSASRPISQKLEDCHHFTAEFRAVDAQLETAMNALEALMARLNVTTDAYQRFKINEEGERLLLETKALEQRQDELHTHARGLFDEMYAEIATIRAFSQTEMQALVAIVRRARTTADPHEQLRILQECESRALEMKETGTIRRMADLKAMASVLENARRDYSARRDARTRKAPPPVAAEFILLLLSNPSHRDGLVGDFDETFRENRIKYGRHRANYLYWADVIRSIWPLLHRLIRRLGLWSVVILLVKRFTS